MSTHFSLDEFESEVVRTLSELSTKYGFAGPSVRRFGGNHAVVDYTRELVRISTQLEFGEQIFLEVWLLDELGRRPSSKSASHFQVDQLAKLRNPDWIVPNHTVATKRELRKTLASLHAALVQFAPEVLTGDALQLASLRAVLGRLAPSAIEALFPHPAPGGARDDT